MVRFAANSPFALALAAAASLSAGCYDTTSSTTSADYPTLLTVDPQSFRGAVTCGAPGLVSYVVTLTNYTTSGPDIRPSSDAILCHNPISFTAPAIEIDHYYTGQIDGYDREVMPVTLGEPAMVDSSGAPVAPAWVTTCGEVRTTEMIDPDADVDADLDAAADLPPYNPLRYPTLVLPSAEVFLHGCLPLTAAPAPDASVSDGSTPTDAAEEADLAQDAGPDADPDAADATDPDGGGFRR